MCGVLCGPAWYLLGDGTIEAFTVPLPPEAMVATLVVLRLAASAWRSFTFDISGSRVWMRSALTAMVEALRTSRSGGLPISVNSVGRSPGMRSTWPFMSAVRRAASSLITIQRTVSAFASLAPT